jgi:ABC-type nitrate/sulfonate/bicarbonate transport system substrate-binding protein
VFSATNLGVSQLAAVSALSDRLACLTIRNLSVSQEEDEEMAVQFGPNRRAGKFGAILATVISVFAIVGLNAGVASASTCKTTTTVSLMDVVSVDFTQLAIMQRDGFDANYCLNIQTQVTPSAGTIPAAVASGQVDAGYINSGALASAIQQHLNVKALLPLEVATAENNGFYVNVNGPIKSLKNFVGKTVGLLALDSSAQAALELNLLKAGVNPSQVKMIAYPFPQIGPGILSGQLDVGQLAEPFLSQAKAKGSIREIVPTYTIYGPHPPTTYYIVNATWAAQHQSVVAQLEQALSQGILKAIRYPNEIDNLTGLQNPALTAAVLKGQEPPMFSIDPQYSVLMSQWSAMKKVGILTSALPKPYSAFIKPTPVPGSSKNVLWDTAPGQTVNGASGQNDTIFGYNPDVRLIAGPGRDVIDDVGGSATIKAGAGPDTIIARVGKNTVICGKGRDIVYATKKDVLKGCTHVHYTAAPQKLLKSFGWGAGGKFPA